MSPQRDSHQMNTTSINFTYGKNGQLNVSGVTNVQAHNNSYMNPQYDKLMGDNKELKKMNESLHLENFDLKKEVASLNVKASQVKKFEIQSDILKMELKKK